MFILGFFSGIAATIIMAFLILFIINRRQKSILAKDEITKVNVDNELVEEIIKRNRDKVIKGRSMGISNNYQRIQEGVRDITEEVAKLYFPNSKYPKYELTIEEALLLTTHISQRLSEQLKKKRYKLLRELRVSQIMYINDAKKNIMEKDIVAKLNKYKVIDIVRSGWMIYNIANPFYWARKLLVTGGVEAAFRSFGTVIINTVGEEVNSVYSKSFKLSRETFEQQKLEFKEKK